jgi:inosine/xanthosine triphosphate pyrophosphatase family protein
VYGYFDGDELKIIPGHLNGTIATSPRGEGGYGWDKIFQPDGYDGLTRAELSEELDIESYNKLRDFDALRAFLEVKRK